jgi:hypothetical protein
MPFTQRLCAFLANIMEEKNNTEELSTKDKLIEKLALLFCAATFAAFFFKIVL